MKYEMTWDDFYFYCSQLSGIIPVYHKYKVLYPIPKNGLFIATELSSKLNIPISHDFNNILISYKKEEVLIIDDLIDSGKTLSQFEEYDKAVLFVKNNNENKVNFFIEKTDEWIQFPFEKENDIEDSIIRQLEYIGENPNREGLIDTPKRIVKSWNELYAGYKMNPNDIMTTFEDGSCDEMVLLKQVNFFSMCEHHLQPFFGQCNLAYVPDKKVIGLSKLARMVEIFARRLQIQEKMTSQIADCLMEYLQPKGCMVLVEAKHLCMISRGIKSHDAEMTTSAIRGVFKEQEVRNEFLNLIKR